jgi:glycerol-3-phosphate dehydrogenase (NAD(P)+)
LTKFKTAIVFGAGAFGTSLASILSKNFETVILKVRSQDVYDCITKDSENSVYLPGHKLSSNIIACQSWEEFEEKKGDGIELMVSGLPSSAIESFSRENFGIITEMLDQGAPFVSLSKGIDAQTLELPCDIYNKIFPEYAEQFCYLSGPSFAKEILEEQVTVVSLGGRVPTTLKAVAKMLQTDYFKAFLTYDIPGILLGGALKNVLAICGGIIEGLGYNHNTRAAMITMGINEIIRFGTIFNARPETFYGLSGMGDLILTTTGDLSRNKSFGLEIAKGRKPIDIINSQRTVVEGYKTTKAVQHLIEKYQVRSRIFEGVYQVLYKGADPGSIIKNLMRLPPRFEIQ